jgi:sulfur-carrier protein adenylyltransferase/sulfurtransferase
MAIPTLSVDDLKALREQRKPHLLLDVREPDEYEIAKIDGSMLIPLNQLPSRLAELPKDKPIVVHCHHGGRSAQATGFLNQNGFSASNLAGGIDAWSERVDPAVARY